MEFQYLPLKDQITNEFNHYKDKISNSRNAVVYIGKELGETDHQGNEYNNGTHINIKSHLDGALRTDKELINIAISKINIEDEYVSFQLHKFFGFLYDVELLSEDVYNQLIYGSTNEKFIKLVK